jgi:sarcosine oxidase subunit alpha
MRAIWPLQQPAGLGDPAGGQGATDTAAAHPFGTVEEHRQHGHGDAMALAQAGSQVNLVDLRGAVRPELLASATGAGITVQTASTVTDVYGHLHAKRCRISGYDVSTGRVMGGPMELDVDLVAMSGGWTPTVHLSSHRNVKPVYRSDIACFVPGGFDRAQFGAGAMVGCQTWSQAVDSGWQAGAQAAADVFKKYGFTAYAGSRLD